MKAVVRTEYGGPEVLRLEGVPVPEFGDDEVLVRVHAASVNAGDWHLMRGDPFPVRLTFGGLRRPKIRTLGTDMAGRVEAVGGKVSALRPGDAVFGDLSPRGFGAFAEFVSVPETLLVRKPEAVSFEEAAAMPVSGVAALQALRKGGLRSDMRVLVSGASGGVGHLAVQIAKARGAHVTGVCSAEKAPMVRSIGADHVVDYRQEDVTDRDERFDLIIDAAGFRPIGQYQRIMTRDSSYVFVGGSARQFFRAMLLGRWLSRGSRGRVVALMSEPNREDLLVLGDLMETKGVKPVVGRTFTLAEVPEAIGYLEERRAAGKVVIRMKIPDHPAGP